MRYLLFAIVAVSLHGETGYQAWLRYAPVDRAAYEASVPAVAAVLGDAPAMGSARQELIRGVRGMLGRTLREESGVPQESAIVLGTVAEIRRAAPQWGIGGELPPDGFRLKTVAAGALRYTVVAGGSDRGVLYGAFALLRKIAMGEPVSNLDEQQAPYAPARWVNQWDNLDGSIERGYGGRSIFWEDGHVREDLSRAADYARLLASIGINACSINNVNANPKVLTAEMIPQIARIAGAMRPWGVRVAISVDFGSPKSVGGLDTFDPLDPSVAAWWKSKADELYKAVPDLAGFVLKADSEGRVGPSTYGRSHADAANVVGRALAPHGGLLFYRGFVYDHHMDWRNPKNDRGRAAYDNFQPLDGKFDDNVIVQIKNGPIDFQVREPASPLFGALEKTNEAIELQVTQEYMGQARHTVFLAPMWKEALDFDLHAKGAGTPVKALAAGHTFGRPTGGFVGVVNVGLDENWTGNHLSQANLYAFGRLAWDPDLSAQRISDEWTRLTFGGDPKVVSAVNEIQLSSWRTYEDYTGPLGLQNLTDITGNHYSVNVEASERNGWGQWHRADEQGVGMDRTVATGTGYIGQYRPAVAKVYEALESVSGRSSAVPASRAVHVQAALGEDRDPVPLRFALRRRGQGRRVCAAVEDAARERGRPALRRSAGAVGIPGGAGDCVARCRDALVCAGIGDCGCEGTRGPVSRAGRGGIDGTRGLHDGRRGSLGGGFGREGCDLRSGHLHGGFAVRRGGGVVHASRAVLRPRGGSGAVPRAGR